MRAHPSPDLQFNVILSFSSETPVFFAASSTLKSIVLSLTTPKVMALEGFLRLAISKLPIMIIMTSACVMMVAMTIVVMMMMMEAMKMTVMVMLMFVAMMMMISRFD